MNATGWTIGSAPPITYGDGDNHDCAMDFFDTKATRNASAAPVGPELGSLWPSPDKRSVWQARQALVL